MDFAINASNNSKIFFTSSVGVATNFPGTEGPVPESRIHDFSIAGFGYGESKLAAETVLLEAAEKSGVPVTICRVGQIAGPVGEAHQGDEWNRKEWFPSVRQLKHAPMSSGKLTFTHHIQIIEASSYLSKLPDTLGKNERIDWIPVDELSSIILELAGIVDSPIKGKTLDSAPSIVHAVNPHKVEWRELLSSVKERLSAKRSVDIVPLAQWVEALESAAKSTVGHKEQAEISAFKLVPFFAGLSGQGKRPEFDTLISQKHSLSLQNLQRITDKSMGAWLSQWNFNSSSHNE